MPQANRREISTDIEMWVWEEAKLSRENQYEEVEVLNYQRAEVSLEHRAGFMAIQGWECQEERKENPSMNKAYFIHSIDIS